MTAGKVQGLPAGKLHLRNSLIAHVKVFRSLQDNLVRFSLPFSYLNFPMAHMSNLQPYA